MQTIFEIFDCFTGKTLGYRHTEAVALRTCQRIAGKDGFSGLDHLPAKDEGFYVVDMRGFVRSPAIANRADAERKADMENMSSDYNSFSVVEHTL